MGNSEDSGKGDFVRDDRQTAEILRKIILSVISMVLMIAGELTGKDNENLKK